MGYGRGVGIAGEAGPCKGVGCEAEDWPVQAVLREEPAYSPPCEFEIARIEIIVRTPWRMAGKLAGLAIYAPIVRQSRAVTITYFLFLFLSFACTLSANERRGAPDNGEKITSGWPGHANGTADL